MAEKPADRNAEAPYKMSGVYRSSGWTGKLDAVANEISDALATEMAKRTKDALNKANAKLVDKMHVYVNGKHVLSTDADKAHAVAASYMKDFTNSVWLSRKVISK